MTTTLPSVDAIERSWYIVDAEGQTLGRLATRIATVLRGKHKPTFAPHMDVGDYVVVINADKVALTGRKLDQKEYYRYSGYAGGLRVDTAREVLAGANPDRVVRQAVKGMLPKNRLARQVIGKLKIYTGSEHPHAAQKPQPFPEFVR